MERNQSSVAEIAKKFTKKLKFVVFWQYISSLLDLSISGDYEDIKFVQNDLCAKVCESGPLLLTFD